ncbi:Flp pilus assembly complex ATPase component TadA [bacterium]|nr:Flp pilus assembly complex ATPase component TadA [bacterium]
MMSVKSIAIYDDLGLKMQQRLIRDEYVEGAVNEMIGTAIQTGASDIVIEPSLKQFSRVRFRLNGLFYPVTELKKEDSERIISRLKVLADIPVYLQGRALEGRIEFQDRDDCIGDCSEYGRVELRMSSIPAIGGQRVALRILDPRKSFKELEHLGFPDDICEELKEIVSRKQGLFIICGPTSSGKTTTLYALLKYIHSQFSQTKQVIVIEDPVEFPLDGVPQIQVSDDSGFGFEEALKAVLRQDPEVIGLGEIRDGATARMAVRAALTGHMVLGTVHAGCAEEVPGRLRDLGTDRRLLAGALSGVFLQRLGQKKCDCPEGCDKCLGTGIAGRIPYGVFTPVTSDFRNRILSREVFYGDYDDE